MTVRTHNTANAFIFMHSLYLFFIRFTKFIYTYVKAKHYSLNLTENSISSSELMRYAGSTSLYQLSMPPTPRIAPHTVTTVLTGIGSSSICAACSSCCGVYGIAEKAKVLSAASKLNSFPSAICSVTLLVST